MSSVFRLVLRFLTMLSARLCIHLANATFRDDEFMGLTFRVSPWPVGNRAAWTNASLRVCVKRRLDVSCTQSPPIRWLPEEPDPSFSVAVDQSKPPNNF